MNLATKTKYVNIVIRVKNYIPNKEKIKSWCDIECETYCFIIHEKDNNPLTGEIIQPHCHLVLVLNQAIRLSTCLRRLTDYLDIITTGVEIDKTSNFDSSVQYLLHKNDKDKTQHNINEIISNLDREELQTIIDSNSFTITADYLINLCMKTMFITDVIKTLGLNYFNMYRATIMLIWNDCEKFKNGDILNEEIKRIRTNNNTFK